MDGVRRGYLAPQDAVLYIVDFLSMGVCLDQLLAPWCVTGDSNIRVLPGESQFWSPIDAHQLTVLTRPDNALKT